jgi:hypothetical protein
MNTNLLYCSVFDKKEVEYLQLFLISLKIFSKCDTFDILIITSPDFKTEIDTLSIIFDLTLNTIVRPSNKKSSVFDYENIEKYNKFLLLNVDILFQKDVSILFELDLENKLYMSKNNGTILHKATNSLNVRIDTELLDTYVFMTNEENPVSPMKDKDLIMNYFNGETKISKKNRMIYHLYHLLDTCEQVEPNDKVTFTQYKWGSGNISFENHNVIITTWSRGTYRALSNMVYSIAWSNTKHIAIFNNKYDSFTSITLPELNIQNNVSNNALKASIPIPCPRNSLTIKTGNRKLIYFCAFHKKEYLFLLRYLLISMKTFSKVDNKTDFLIFTSVEFANTVKHLTRDLNIDIKVKFFNFTTQHEAGCARLHIFEYEKINDYSQILYMDTDILIQRDLSLIFDCLKEDKVYAKQEYDLYGAGHGGYFFDFTKYKKNQPSLNSGVLLFRNSPAVRAVFHDINTHIANLKSYDTIWPGCMDQPFISYHFITNSMCDIISLTPLICLSEKGPPPPRDMSQHVILHFVWPIGNALHKMDRMKKHLNLLTSPYPVPPVILHSCDSYKRFWNPWYHFFKKHVKGNYKIYFLSEEDSPDFADEVINIKTGKGEWGERLLKALKIIPEEHVYYMQEDFWACAPMELSHMDLFNEYNMQALRISGECSLYTTEKINNNLYKFAQNSRYLMTHQFSLWDKAFFMKFIRPSDSPWKNELDQTDILTKLQHSIYILKEPWYNATVRRGKVDSVGEKMLEDIKKDT